MLTKTLSLTLITAAIFAAPSVATATTYDAAGAPIPEEVHDHSEPDKMQFESRGDKMGESGPVLDVLYDEAGTPPPSDSALLMVPPPGEFGWLDIGKGFACPVVSSPDHLKIPNPLTRGSIQLPLPQVHGWCFAHAAAYVRNGEMGAFAMAHGAAEEDWTGRNLWFSAHADAAAGWNGGRVGAHLIVVGDVIFSRYEQNQPYLGENIGWDFFTGSTLRMTKVGVNIQLDYSFDVGAGIAYEVTARNVKVYGDGHVKAKARAKISNELFGSHSAQLDLIDADLWMGASTFYRFAPGGVKICGNYRVVNHVRALEGKLEILGTDVFSLSPITPVKIDERGEDCTPTLPVW